MGEYNIKLRLLTLGKTQRSLLDEIRKRGFVRLQQPALSAYINGGIRTPQAETVLKVADKILTEWED